jgi:hypothetical protein
MNRILVVSECLIVLIHFECYAVSLDDRSLTAVPVESALFLVFVALSRDAGDPRGIRSWSFLSDHAHTCMVRQRGEDALRHLLILHALVLGVSKLHETCAATWGSFSVFPVVRETHVKLALIFRPNVLSEEGVR